MPERFATVDEFLAAQAPEQRAAVESLRVLVHEAEPRLTEIVKWNSPDYTLDGVDRLTINAVGTRPVRLILHFGTGRAEDKGAAPTFSGDPDRLLTWHSDIRASLVMPTAGELPSMRDAIIAVIRAWLSEGVAGPTNDPSWLLVVGAAYTRTVATLDDLRRTAVGLPGSEERATMGGAAWFVRGKLYAWECHPWPSIPADMRAIIAAELVVGVKVAERLDALALVEMEPDVFLRTTTTWGEPKVAFRMAGIDDDHLAELVTEAWRVQAPKYLRRELDDGGS